MADDVTIEASLLRDLMETHDGAACGCRHYDDLRPKPCALLDAANAALKMSEGSARTQSDPRPSDAAQSVPRLFRSAQTCTLCHGRRIGAEMAWVNDDPYCHGALDESPTCYEMSGWPAEDVDRAKRGRQVIATAPFIPGGINWPDSTRS